MEAVTARERKTTASDFRSGRLIEEPCYAVTLARDQLRRIPLGVELLVKYLTDSRRLVGAGDQEHSISCGQQRAGQQRDSP